MSESIRFPVWPISVPPVPTFLWDQASWDRHAEGERPEGYTGGIHDTTAWLKFYEERKTRIERELREEFYARYGMHWDEAAGEAVPD